MDEREAAKQRAAKSATQQVEDGSIVGLGTGSTAACAVRQLGRRVDSGLSVTAIETSHQSRALAREAGIELTSLDVDTPDIAIDGADQVASGDLIKGGGAAHAREKVVDGAATRFLVVVDSTKRVDALDEPVPVEVLPAAREPVASAVDRLGGEATVREATAKDGPVVTDNGNLVLDCAFGQIDTPEQLAADIDGIPGVVAHGLFVEMADEIHVGTDEGVRVERF